MTGKNHLIFGVTSGFLLDAALLAKTGNTYGIDVAAGIITLSALGSLLPDIDSPKSKIGKILFFLSYPINKMFGHRTFTHSLFFLLIGICSYAAYSGDFQFMRNFYPIAFCVGFLGHLIQDTFTKGGCPWLYPFKRTRYSLSKQKYGSKMELFFTILLLMIFVMVLTVHDYIFIDWMIS